MRRTLEELLLLEEDLHGSVGPLASQHRSLHERLTQLLKGIRVAQEESKSSKVRVVVATMTGDHDAPDPLSCLEMRGSRCEERPGADPCGTAVDARAAVSSPTRPRRSPTRSLASPMPAFRQLPRPPALARQSDASDCSRQVRMQTPSWSVQQLLRVPSTSVLREGSGRSPSITSPLRRVGSASPYTRARVLSPSLALPA